MKRPRRWARLPEEVRREVIRLGAAGKSYQEIVDSLDVAMGSVTTVLKPLGGVYRRELWASPSPNRLGMQDRMTIWQGLERGLSYAAIGRSLSPPRDKSTVCREVNANGGPGQYQPLAGERRAANLRCRSRPTKLATNPALAAQVTERLEKLHSPQQIAASLRQEFGDDATMTVSHETIYKSLYVQGRGELRRELTACLRTGRARRRARQTRPTTSGKIPDMVMISERPAEVEDRAVPGHWEGDLILGRNGKSAVGTLVERTTRYVMLLHLDGARTAEVVRDAMSAKIATLPDHLARSITWDQGKEMSQHVQFTVDTNVPVFFCDPHSPWQRGSNENTNGLLRQYMPKGTDLSVHSAEDLDHIAHSLNSRPRHTLGWKTPAQALHALTVATTG